jgi:hypothetical protein
MTTLFLIHLAHLLVFSTLLFYIGVMGVKLPGFIFPLLLVLAVGILGYHVYKAISMPKYAWVNYIHIFLVVPLFLVIGYYGKATPSMFFEFSLMLGFAAFGYHGYSMLKEMYVPHSNSDE